VKAVKAEAERVETINPEPPKASESSLAAVTPALGLFADLEKLRLNQDLLANCGVTSCFESIRITRPSKEWFIRVHPTARLNTGIIELRDDNEIYIVAPELWASLAAESTFGPRALVLAVTKQGTPFIWPIRLPSSDGRIDSWNKSALTVATGVAVKHWVRLQPDKQAQGYKIDIATADYGEPKWPDLSWEQILQIAFRDFEIHTLDAPVLQRLRGRA
jgi:hypothetical protein